MGAGSDRVAVGLVELRWVLLWGWGEGGQGGSRGSDQPGAAVIVAWEWTSCLSPHGGDAHDRGGNITNRTRANWQAYRKYLLDS